MVYSVKENQPMPIDAKVLVVDDEEPVRKTLVRFFRSLGIQNVLEASNGQEAVEKADANRDIQFILMDLKMPVQDGIGAVEAIRAILPKVKITILTGYPFYGDADTAVRQGGIVDFIVKPVDLDYLEKIVKTVLPLDWP